MQKDYFEATAPGRLDVMGGIADYSGSLVLQMPIEQKTSVTIRFREDGKCIINSIMAGEKMLQAEVDYNNYLDNGQVNYNFARQQFRKSPENSWIAYVLGCVLVLQKEKGIPFKGASIELNSNVPLGKGVSSSASLEVATMKALQKSYNLSFSGTELPILAQQVENLLVGAPCGLMDQLASYFGEERKLLPILCQPDLVKSPIAIPQDIYFMGIDSGVRHSVQGASYGQVRCAAFMGYTIIAKACGAGIDIIRNSKKSGDRSSLPFQGYLCNISVEEFEQKFSSLLPKSIKGKEFLNLFGDTIDQVTNVEPDTDYAIYNCTKHPIYENERVHHFLQYLKMFPGQNNQHDELISQMGNLMFKAHESYSSCGLGSARTDEIVNKAKTLNKSGVMGAKITGGGSGGTVCLLAYGEQGRAAVKKMHKELCKEYNQNLILF